MSQSPAQALAQTFFSFCKEEVRKGGDYRTRIRNNRLYHEARGVIRNVDAIVEKAEGDMALAVLTPQITRHYQDLVEGFWQSHNFDVPIMRKNRTVEAYESLEMTRAYLKDTYPELYKAAMRQGGENWLRREYAKAIYKVEKARNQEWWSRNPITYRYGGKTEDIRVFDGRPPLPYMLAPRANGMREVGPL